MATKEDGEECPLIFLRHIAGDYSSGLALSLYHTRDEEGRLSHRIVLGRGSNPVGEGGGVHVLDADTGERLNYNTPDRCVLSLPAIDTRLFYAAPAHLVRIMRGCRPSGRAFAVLVKWTRICSLALNSFRLPSQ
jgi:hypothetical protein